MREISVQAVADQVERLFLFASTCIGRDVEEAVKRGIETESSPAGRAALEQIAENYEIAREERVAICQDTGMAVIFADIGQDVRLTGGDFEAAVNEGVRRAYLGGYLRKSVVSDPLFDRKNTRDNTPAVLHTRIVPGDRVRLLVTPKGFGSENISRMKMLVPADGVEGVKKFVVETVREAGPNPCPPVIVGVGIGGTMEKAALIAKQMTARPVGSRNATQLRGAGGGAACAGQPHGRTGRHRRALTTLASASTTRHASPGCRCINDCCHAARHAEECSR